jgi:hypothetical protein
VGGIDPVAGRDLVAGGACLRGRRFQEAAQLLLGVQQAFHLLTQVAVAVACLVQVGGPFLGGAFLQGSLEEGLHRGQTGHD